MDLSLEKAIIYGREQWKPYGKAYGNYAKLVDSACRNHGGCPWREENRTNKDRKRAAGMEADMKDREGT